MPSISLAILSIEEHSVKLILYLAYIHQTKSHTSCHPIFPLVSNVFSGELKSTVFMLEHVRSACSLNALAANEIHYLEKEWTTLFFRENGLWKW